MPNIPLLQPESQFPTQAIQESVQKFPAPNNVSGSFSLVFDMASSADMISPWGKNIQKRDRELRQFWPTEPNLAGAMANICMRNAAFDFVIKSENTRLETAVTDMLTSSLGPPGQVGWSAKETAVSQDYYATDNGAFEEIIRDPGLDANSQFKAERAPVIGIAHLDSGQCVRTGNPEYPVLYTDRDGKVHKLAWYQVIPFCEMPSPIATMNGVGVCAVSRVLRAAQIMRSMAILTDEMVSGRNFKKINIVGGVNRADVEDARKRGQEQSDNLGHLRYIEHLILCGLDPEKPVSVATIDLAGFPTDFNYDIYMKWYISTLALGFVVDYQDFAPLPGGNIGSSSQSEILSKKSSAKGPATYMRSKIDAYKIYGVLPRNCEMVYDDKNQAEELERQVIRTKAMEEVAISTRNYVLTPGAARKDLVKRGIYDRDTIDGIPENYGEKEMAPKQTIGQTGGNTIAENASRTPTGAQSETVGDRLQKETRERSSLLSDVRNMFSHIMMRKETPSNVNVTVHNEPGKPPNVIVQAPKIPVQKPANVTVNIPQQKPPITVIKQVAPRPANVTVNVPEQKPPQVTVNVPQQAAPQVTVNNPITVVGPKGPKNVEIEYDANGKPIGLKANGDPK